MYMDDIEQIECDLSPEVAPEQWMKDDEELEEAVSSHEVELGPHAEAAMASLLDMGAFEQLVRSHGPRLASFVRRRVGNPSDVEDIVQDTFVEAMKGLARYRGHSRPETWIFGIALNLIRSHYKRGRVRDVVSADDEVEAMPAQPGGDPSQLVEHREILQRLTTVCASLNAETRQMLALVFDDCMTYEEAAGMLGIPVGTIRSRISRVRVLLRQSAC